MNSRVIQLLNDLIDDLTKRHPPRHEFKISNINNVIGYLTQNDIMIHEQSIHKIKTLTSKLKSSRIKIGKIEDIFNIIQNCNIHCEYQLSSETDSDDNNEIVNNTKKSKYIIESSSEEGESSSDEDCEYQSSIKKSTCLIESSSDEEEDYDNNILSQEMIKNTVSKKNYEKIHSITEINELVKSIIKESIPNYITISGEVSNISIHNGNVYLYLKDKSSRIKGIIWKSNNRNIELQNGDKVKVVGKMDLFLRSGEYQIIIYSIKKLGLGDNHLDNEKIKQELEKKGYFDEKYKKPIKTYNQRIGIVSSTEAAGYRDMLHKIRSKNKWVKLYISPTSVQGKDCPNEVALAIKRLQSYPLDVIIVARGGGSKEDLAWFDDIKIVNAIFKSKIPIITGIGHEKDTSLADLVADYCCITPTAAAEKVTFDSQDILHNIQNYKENILNQYSNQLLRYLNYNNDLMTNNIESYSKKLLKKIETYKESIRKSMNIIINNYEQRLTLTHYQLKDYYLNKLRIIPNQYRVLLHKKISQELDKYKESLLKNEMSLKKEDPKNMFKSGFIMIENSNGEQINNIDKLMNHHDNHLKLYFNAKEYCLVKISKV